MNKEGDKKKKNGRMNPTPESRTSMIIDCVCVV